MIRKGISASDEALVSAAANGDRAAFAELAARYRRIAYAVAYAQLRHRETAEDVVQEALIKAFSRLPSFRRADRWAAWLMRIVRNAATDAARRRSLRSAEPIPPHLMDSDDNPEEQLLAQERLRTVAAAVQALPEKFRLPIVLHYGSGLTVPEAALALGLPASTVIGRIAGGLRILRRRLGHERLQ